MNNFLIIYAEQLCQGVPGTLSFLFNVATRYKNPNEKIKAISGFSRMLDNKIVGSKLYMLWNDCLNRDIDKTIYVMLHDSIDEINRHINFENGKGIPYLSNEPKPYIKEHDEWWIFTFLNDGSEKAGKCIKIRGTYGEARNKMVSRYGTYFGFQYSEKEWAEKWNDPNRDYQMEDILEIIK